MNNNQLIVFIIFIIASATISSCTVVEKSSSSIVGKKTQEKQQQEQQNAAKSQEESKSSIKYHRRNEEGCTDIVRDDETLLVLSTLGGGLTAVDPLSGDIRWQIDDEPINIHVQQQQQQQQQHHQSNDLPFPQYLPNPRDGSLYQLGDMGGLRKLPYTIPELVANAPCRSSDGILYSGRKSDVWYLIDPKTGRREQLLGFESQEDNVQETIGWSTTSRYVYLGRTQYTVLMYDSLSNEKNSKPWNVTFFDYSSHTMTPEISQKYEWLHLCGSASGLTVTLNRKNGVFRWQQHLMSPIVDVFLLSSEGLLSVPFQTVSDDALKNIAESSIEGQRTVVNLYETLYVGDHPLGLYAIPSLVEKNTATISSNPPVKLLGGPMNDGYDGVVDDDEDDHDDDGDDDGDNELNQLINNKNKMIIKRQPKKNVIVMGNYQIPKIATDVTINIEPSTTSTTTKTSNSNYNIIKKPSNNNNEQYKKNILTINNNNEDDDDDDDDEKIIKLPSSSPSPSDESYDHNDQNKKILFDPIINHDDHLVNGKNDEQLSKEINNQSTKKSTNINNNNNNNNTKIKSKTLLLKFYQFAKNWLNDHENNVIKLMVIIWAGTMIAMFWYSRNAVRQARQIGSGTQQQQSQQQDNDNDNQSGNNSNNGSKGGSQSGGGGSGESSNKGLSYQELIDLGNGEIKVGKICFNSYDVLGKGCEGTFVFKGTFEKRAVAVKRLLPECFTFADREVTLLRESDMHENVVRYFCTEQDRQFRYIAVELCAATLQDYVEHINNHKGYELRKLISFGNVLEQATNGLMHLHSLNIVHRDIKPQNVLLSLPQPNGSVRAMISDFGLCKKLNYGKTSFSKRSGITGTEGWIAPEMLKGQRTTTSVDIFSLGCVYYYVISMGGHPFGDTVKRQLNILSYEYDLKYFREHLDYSMILAEELITDMISKDPLRRPSARAILKHPYFWKEDKILNFFQDVSDRIDKADYSIEPLRTLEKHSKFIVNQDWNLHLDAIITADLRKHRGYQGASVRDLLRAIRNKKHHFHELNLDIQQCLGEIPFEFTKYWIEKFPYLLSHSYHTLQLCSNENHFKIYYDKMYVFTKPDYFYRITNDTDYVPFQQQQQSSPDDQLLIMKREYIKNNNRNQNNQNNQNNNNDNIIKNRKSGSYNFHHKNNNNNNMRKRNQLMNPDGIKGGVKSTSQQPPPTIPPPPPTIPLLSPPNIGGGGGGGAGGGGDDGILSPRNE